SYCLLCIVHSICQNNFSISDGRSYLHNSVCCIWYIPVHVSCLYESKRREYNGDYDFRHRNDYNGFIICVYNNSNYLFKFIMLTDLLILIVLLILSAFFSASEMAYVIANKIKIEVRARKKNLAAANAQYFVNAPQHFFSTILIGNNIVNITFAS